MAVFEWASKVDGKDEMMAADVNKLAQGILDNQDKINNSVNTTTEQTIDGRKIFTQEVMAPSIRGTNPNLTITCGYSLNLTSEGEDVNINANNGVGNVNINGSVLAQDGIATASVTSLDGHLELMSDDMDITAGGQICMNGSTGISINCPTDILIESTNSSVNINGNVTVNGNNIADLFTAIQELQIRVTTLEEVNADLENIIALQQSYIGGVGA